MGGSYIVETKCATQQKRLGERQVKVLGIFFAGLTRQQNMPGRWIIAVSCKADTDVASNCLHSAARIYTHYGVVASIPHNFSCYPSGRFGHKKPSLAIEPANTPETALSSALSGGERSRNALRSLIRPKVLICRHRSFAQGRVICLQR